MSLFSKVTRFASSPQGRALVDKAKQAAQDPKNREKIEQIRSKRGRKH